MNAMEFRFLLFLLLASIPFNTVRGGILKPESELTLHDELEAFSSDEDEGGDYVDNSAYENDDKYDEKEEMDQATQDAITSCKNNVTEAKINRSEPYACFDFSDKKQMTHYLVRPAGTTVKLFCNVKGNPTPSIRWLKNGMPFDKPNYLTKFSKNALRLIDVGKNVGGKYTCKVVSPDPTVKPITYDIRLEVPDRNGATPIIRSDLMNRTVGTGERLIIDCGFKSDHAAITTTFVFKTDVYTTEAEFVILDKAGNLTEAQSRTDDEDLLHDPTILALDNVTFADEGWYSCIVGNSVGRSFTSAYISVVEEIQKDDILKSHPIHGDLYRYQIAFVAIAGILFVFLVISFAICVYSKKQERLRRIEAKNRPGGWTKQVIIERRPIGDDEGAILIPEVNIKSVESTNTGQEYDFPVDLEWEFPRNQLTLGDKLGEGAFGEVLLGKAQEIVKGKGMTTVAVKSLKKTHTDAELIDLITELETMKLVSGENTNIINLLGCCSQGGDLLVIMEFCEKGNLRDYLRYNAKNYYYHCPPPPDMIGRLTEGQEVLTFKDLMSFAFQVARGMEYLVQKKYVHRDLAARNILVTGSGAGKIVKIADFGMTRSTFTNDYYRKKSEGRVPIKWMAPETLFHRIYTTHSDVWSYGILLWEIVTLGRTPYPSMDVTHILDYLRGGKRMSQPEHCPDGVYMQMLYCWVAEPAARPQFSELAKAMEVNLHIAAKLAKAEYMDMEQIDTYHIDPDAEIETPQTSPENSDGGVIIFDPALWVD